MNRRDFVLTSAGFLAAAILPGIWSCSRPVGDRKKYSFESMKSDQIRVPVLKVTPDDGFYVHTYFDVTPFSPSQRYFAVTKLPFQDHIPQLGDTAEICVIDLEKETIQTVYKTKTWGYQTGANVQWGGSDRYVYTNDLINGKAVMVEIDLESDAVTAFETSMYNVARDGSYAIGFPLELLNVTQQGYGMPSKETYNPPSLPAGMSKDQGVWRANLKTRKSELLYSIAHVASKVPEPMPKPDGTYYFWHSKYNRQVTRIMQILRCIFPGFDGERERNPMVLTLSADGKEVFSLGQDPVWDYPAGGGHANWHPDGEHIIRNMKPDGKTLRVCQVKYDGSDFKVLSETFQSGGHPSIESSGRYVITDHRDTIDKDNQVISVILLDTVADKAEKICTLPTINTQGLKLITKTMRLDGHPCWSRDYKKVSLQAAPEGKRQLFVLDLSQLI